MPIQRYDISHDPQYDESWPDLLLTRDGKLICVFCECTHHSDRSYSRIAYTESTDRGQTWSPKRYLTDPCRSDGTTYWDCPRISHLRDGRVVVVCDFVTPEDDRIYLWLTDDEATAWTGPVHTPCSGIVPDKLLETIGGRWILTCHTDRVPGYDKLQQRLWFSDDRGHTWSDAITVAQDERYNLCEGSVLEIDPGVLVCLMRENSAEGYECMVTKSTDHGLHWCEVYTIPLACCHRPVAGFLNTGEIMVTYRYRQGAKRGWLGFWTQNTFLAVTDKMTVLTGDKTQQQVRIMPLNYDPGPESDLGYTGWVQFDDGMIYIADYIRGYEDKSHIIGCSLYRDDIGGQRLGVQS